MIGDSSGVSVDTRGADLLHRDTVPYPADAIAKGIQGTVTVTVRIDATGNVADAAIISGPDELRKGVLQSVLNWHFTPATAANSTRVIDVSFTLPAGAAQSVRVRAAEPAVQGPKPPRGAVIRNIQVIGLSDPAREQLLAALPVHTGESASPDAMRRIGRAVRAFDNHLSMASRVNSNDVNSNDVDIIISRPLAVVGGTGPGTVESRVAVPPPPPPAQGTASDAVRIGSVAPSAKLVAQVMPIYPPLAKAARVQGTVSFQAVIDTDGKIRACNCSAGRRCWWNRPKKRSSNGSRSRRW